jgi:hypothetical protein
MSEELSTDLDLRAKFSRELERIVRATGTVVESLRVIRDEKLWRYTDEAYESFGDFCQRHLRMSEGRASQIITATDVALRMTVLLGDDPVLVKQIKALPERTLREVRDITPEVAIKTIREVASKGNGKVTTKALKEALNPVQDVPVVIVPKNKRVGDFSPDDWLMALKQSGPFVEAWTGWSLTEKGFLKQIIEAAIKDGFREEWRKSAIQTPKAPPIEEPKPLVPTRKPSGPNVEVRAPVDMSAVFAKVPYKKP